MESVETTPAVVRAYRYSPDSAYSQPEGSFILGPPIVPEQVDVRDKGARWSSAIAWSAQSTPRSSPEQETPKFPTRLELWMGRSGDSLAGGGVGGGSVGGGGGGGGGGDPIDYPTPPLFVDGGIDPHDFPFPPSNQKPSTFPRRSSSPSPPPSPDSLTSNSTLTRHQAMRSRVSMDALAISRPLSITPTSSRPASPSGPSGEHLDTVRWQIDPPFVFPSQRTVPRSPPSPAPDEQEGIHFVPIDAGLRSAPGVIGLGEGWAGGPQEDKRRGWYRKRRAKEPDSDPLSLWAITEGVEPVSPVKAMWNRSKLRLFGASTTTLNETDSRKKGFFSRSRVNLDLGEEVPSAEVPSAPRRTPFSNRFTRSQADLVTPPATGETLSAPSLPIIVPANSFRAHAKASNDRAAQSDPQLVPSHASSSRDDGELASSTSPTVPPSWRRQALLFARNRSSKTTQVPDLNESRASSSSTTLLGTLDSNQVVPIHSREPSISADLKRTNTFGGPSTTDDHAQSPGPDKVVGSPVTESAIRELLQAPQRHIPDNQQAGKRRRPSWDARTNQRLARLDEDDEEESNETCRPWALAPALPPLHEWQSHSRSDSEPIEGNIRSYTEESISSSDQSTLNLVTPVQPQSYFQVHHTRAPLTPGSSDTTFGTPGSYRSALEAFGDTDSIHSVDEESTVEHAIMVSSLGDNGTKASYISLTELRLPPSPAISLP
ncbi:MAG: hypothetical protein TREMPRED_001715 [Tremellales sp. Tagirdzhanova-0007]|nr:MAG: hypothetical protein TREMPRED_001715 [Tremellales sp. Tagirdzhanova-0007]